MIYETLMRRYMAMDNQVDLPWSLRLYLIVSPRARREIDELQRRLFELRNTAAFDVPPGLCDEIMAQIYRHEVRYVQAVSGMKWFLGGVIIFSSIVLVPFSNSLVWLKTQFGSSLEFPLGVVFGVAITLYSMLFIGTHMNEAEDLKKSIMLKIRQSHWFN